MLQGSIFRDKKRHITIGRTYHAYTNTNHENGDLHAQLRPLIKWLLRAVPTYWLPWQHHSVSCCATFYFPECPQKLTQS